MTAILWQNRVNKNKSDLVLMKKECVIQTVERYFFKKNIDFQSKSLFKGSSFTEPFFIEN